MCLDALLRSARPRWPPWDTGTSPVVGYGDPFPLLLTLYSAQSYFSRLDLILFLHTSQQHMASLPDAKVRESFIVSARISS